MTDHRLERNNWHVVFKTRNGTISFIRNLPLRLAVITMQELTPKREPGVPYHTSDSDIQEMHLLGPEEWDGCKTAMNHEFETPQKTLVSGGPNAGRVYVSAVCTACGHYQSSWEDTGQVLP